MGRFIQQAKVQTSATIILDEVELRAMDALAGYGIDDFLKVFYAQMGESYLKPHEQGLRSLFASIRQEAPGLLRMADDARKAFTGKDSRP